MRLFDDDRDLFERLYYSSFYFSINYFDFDKTGTYINMYVLKYSGMTHTLDLSN